MTPSDGGVHTIASGRGRERDDHQSAQVIAAQGMGGAARRAQGVQEGRRSRGTLDRRRDAAPMARWNHLHLEQGGDAGMTA